MKLEADAGVLAARPPAAGQAPVHPVVDRLAAYGWRLLVIAAVLAATLWLLGRLQLVVLPAVLALFLSRALSPIARWLERHQFRPAPASGIALLAFLGLLGLAGWLIVPAIGDEFDELPSTLSSGVDDFERWLVEDSPFDLNHDDLERFRDEGGEALGDLIGANAGSLVNGAVAAVEVVAGLFLSLFVAFFITKDGRRFGDAVIRRLRPERRELAGRFRNAHGRHSAHTCGAQPPLVWWRRRPSARRSPWSAHRWWCQ